MRPVIGTATVVAALLTAAPVFADNAATIWDANIQANVSAGRPPASAEYLAAIVHLAIWDAVVSIEGRYQPYICTVPVTEPASTDAAIAAAAYRVLKTRVPGQAQNVQAQYDAFLATIPDSPGKTNGITVGEAAAAQLIAARAGDGFDNVVAYVQPPVRPGVFESLLPPPAVPVDIKLKQVEPLLAREIDEFRPDGPPKLTSGRYARDFNEVKTYGRANSTARTQEQTDIALFWSENTYVQFARSLRELAIASGLDTIQSERLFATVYLAAGDAGLAGFESKYHFLFWRPVHAIQRADTDGNERTAKDATWAPLLVINHPEYPSGHSFLTSAITRAVRRFFRTDRIRWTISTTALRPDGTAIPPRTYTSLKDIGAEVENARIWSGLHYRSSMRDGSKLGARIENLAKDQLGPIRGHPRGDCRRDD
jgi:hypothetical protein